MAVIRKIGAVLVQPDDQRFAERDVQPEREVFDLSSADAASMLGAYRVQQKNYSTAPFDPDGRHIRFFPGGYTVWSGNPGNGKTTILRQLACHLMRPTSETQPLAGPGVFICSLEEAPRDVLIRHANVACGTEEISVTALEWCMELWSQKIKLWNYRPIEADARYQRILAAIRIMARDHGVRHAVIDSLMCLDVPVNDLEAQRNFAVSLSRTCESSGVHIHLVAHPRKPANRDQELDIADVAGSADIGRRADNVLFVKRASQDEGVVLDDRSPMRIAVRKQRYGTGWTGEIGGWFHRGFRQFVCDQWQERPQQYLSRYAHETIARAGFA
jgi:twinkle protein